MSDIEAIIIIAVTVICCAAGYSLNKNFTEKYAEAGIDYLAFAFQAFSVLAVMCTWPQAGDVSKWFLLWMLFLIVSYALGILSCRNHAVKIGATSEDIVKAVAAQCILPLGVALVILIILAIATGNSSKKRKKRR